MKDEPFVEQEDAPDKERQYREETQRLREVRDAYLKEYAELLQQARWAEDQAEQAHEKLDEATVALAQHLGLVRKKDEPAVKLP